jgi:hypothetical protein
MMPVDDPLDSGRQGPVPSLNRGKLEQVWQKGTEKETLKEIENLCGKFFLVW